jgi:hypothetical protein
VTPKRFLILAVGLLIAATASAVAQPHPVFNPPVVKYILVAWALTAVMFAVEAGRERRNAGNQDRKDLVFVVYFDDEVISKANPDGTTDSARWEDLERIAIEPYDDPLLWIGPYHLHLTFRSGPLAVPAWSEGLSALMVRLLELPGIDRDAVEALISGGNPSRCVLWTREKRA